MPGNALHCRKLFRSLRTRWKKRIQRTMQSISCLKIIWCWCKCLRAQAANYCINSIQRQWWYNHALLCEDLHNIINPVENPSSVRPHVISGMNLLPLSSYRGFEVSAVMITGPIQTIFLNNFRSFKKNLGITLWLQWSLVWILQIPTSTTVPKNKSSRSVIGGVKCGTGLNRENNNFLRYSIGVKTSAKKNTKSLIINFINCDCIFYQVSGLLAGR